MATTTGKSNASVLHAQLMESLGHAYADADRQEYWETGITDFEDFVDEVVGDVSKFWAPDDNAQTGGSSATASGASGSQPAAK